MTRPSFLRLGLLALTLAVASARLARAEDAAHGEPAPAAAAAHADPNILEFKLPLAVSTVVVFSILLGVLWKFAWGPLSEALDERERKQDETIAAAEAANAESARLLAEHQRQMSSAAEQVRQMLEDARRQSEANAATILQKAQTEVEATRQRAEREIGAAKDQALSEIWSKTADLAVSVAGKVLTKEMTGDDHRRLVASAISELPSANGHGGHTA
jgi:F-type H+-transporting ATPase subunit b